MCYGNLCFPQDFNLTCNRLAQSDVCVIKSHGTWLLSFEVVVVYTDQNKTNLRGKQSPSQVSLSTWLIMKFHSCIHLLLVLMASNSHRLLESFVFGFRALSDRYSLMCTALISLMCCIEAASRLVQGLIQSLGRDPVALDKVQSE